VPSTRWLQIVLIPAVIVFLSSGVFLPLNWLHIPHYCNYIFSFTLLFLQTDFNLLLNEYLSRDSSVGIAMGYGLDDRGSIPGRSKFFCTPQHPDRLGARLASYPTATVSLYLGVNRPGREADHLTYLHLVPKSRMMELYVNSTICLHDIVLN
jgi:hypothetical protein